MVTAGTDMYGDRYHINQFGYRYLPDENDDEPEDDE